MAKENKKIIFWLNCYGHWQPETRQPIEMIGYNQYLNAFIKAVVLLKDRIEAIYISGGLLNSQGQSEAETLKLEIKKRLNSTKINLPIYLDEKSLSTITITRVFVKTIKEKYPNYIPILVCDEVRYKTNCYLIEYFSKQFNFKLDPKETVLPLPRIDTHPNSTIEAQSQKLQAMKLEGVEEIEAEIIAERTKKL